MHLGWSALPRQTSCRVLRSHLGNSDDSVHVMRICTCVKIARPRTAGAVASRPCQARVSIVCHHHTSTSSTMAGGSSHPHHKVDTVQRSGLVWGIDRGHKTERRVPATRPSRAVGPYCTPSISSSFPCGATVRSTCCQSFPCPPVPHKHRLIPLSFSKPSRFHRLPSACLSMSSR